MYLTITTRRRQGRPREGGSGGSWSQSCEPTNRNVIKGRVPGASLHNMHEAHRFEGYGKWRGCAATVHVLIRGGLSNGRSVWLGESN
jgi:hypothetical protein